MVQQTGDNKFGVAKWIVDATASLGTHTTIAAALTSASSGDTIFIRPGTYTENLTLKAGVNLTTFAGESSLDGNATTFNVKIIGKATATFTGNCGISNICLQTNADFVLVVSGSNATIIELNNCFINATNNTAISVTSNGGSIVQMNSTYGNLGATGAYFSGTSGAIVMFGGQYTNSGASTTASTLSNSTFQASDVVFTSIVSTTNSSALTLLRTYVGVGNTTSISLTGTSTLNCDLCTLISGSSSAVSVGAGCTATISSSEISSSNTNVITGAGSLSYGGLTFTSSSSNINVTTQTVLKEGPSRTIGATNTGATNTLTVTNPSNTASSASLLNLTVGGTSSGDAFTTYTVAGTTNWSEGVDNSDSDAYVLAASTALGTTNVIRSSVGGSINYPLQPSFSAYLSGAITNATGDGTVYTIAYNAENYDQGSNFNTGTSTFVAPVAGKYLFTGMTYVQNLGVAHTTLNLILYNSTSGAQYYLWDLNPIVQAVGGVYIFNFSKIISCAASDGVQVLLAVAGSTKTVGILNGATITNFDGALLN